MSKVKLLAEVSLNEYRTMSEHGSIDEASEEAGRLFDEGGEYDDFVVDDNGYRFRLPGYKLVKCECGKCGKQVRAYELTLTSDCNGIPFRRVCEGCYAGIMEGPGYDGEHYTEADECIDADY